MSNRSDPSSDEIRNAAGAGNTPFEVFVVLNRLGVEHGVDLYKISDVAEDLVVPLMDQPVRIDRDALILGYAGVCSSFLLVAQTAGEKYGLSSRDILVELGRRKTMGVSSALPCSATAECASI